MHVIGPTVTVLFLHDLLITGTHDSKLIAYVFFFNPRHRENWIALASVFYHLDAHKLQEVPLPPKEKIEDKCFWTLPYACLNINFWLYTVASSTPPPHSLRFPPSNYPDKRKKEILHVPHSHYDPQCGAIK